MTNHGKIEEISASLALTAFEMQHNITSETYNLIKELHRLKEYLCRYNVCKKIQEADTKHDQVPLTVPAMHFQLHLSTSEYTYASKIQSSLSFCHETYSRVLEKVIDMNPNFSSNQADTFIFLLYTWHKNSY
jgi:hypothetical protein